VFGRGGFASGFIDTYEQGIELAAATDLEYVARLDTVAPAWHHRAKRYA